ncbi:MAG: ABC transporter substrate-binding protein [Pseudomonadota bacterium]
MRTWLRAFVACIALTQATFADSVDRIVSAGGDVSEILYELGVGDKVIAVDTTTVFPVETDALPRIGYVRELSAEGVLSMGADLLIGSHDMGPPATMDNLEAAGMKVEFVPEGVGSDRYAKKVRFIAEAVGKDDRGAEMIAEYEAQLADLAARVDALARKPRVLLILALRDGVPIAAGSGTTGDDMVDIVGGTNVAEFQGWKPMTPESVVAAAPELIFLSSFHVDGAGGSGAIMDLPTIQATPAGANGNFVVVNSQKMLQFGPRSPEAMDQMLSAIEALVAE